MIKAFLNWWHGADPHHYIYELSEVLSEAYSGGFTVSSDMARAQAGWVAMAATLQLITTREPDGSYGRTWFITKAGIDYLDTYWDN